MPTSPRPLVAGNWKMNGLRAMRSEVRRMERGIRGMNRPRCEVLVCPPATLLWFLRDELSGIRLGAQDCHPEREGAHTGDISAEMLRDVGARYVIVGHSERRTDHGERDTVVAAKARAAHRAGLTAIVCVGETEAERRARRTMRVIRRQIAGSLPEDATARNTLVAYEPVWAIGTGVTPTPDEVAEVHAFIRSELTQRFGDKGPRMRILYGGSVKPVNAAELMAVENVNGALVGGASLTARDFLDIIRVYDRPPSSGGRTALKRARSRRS